ncbi:MAG: radical SAM protein, partial [Alphaproteobacteria bacterium]|nr:radical SAM protein [Alphaproteobacteria bacterium]
MNHIAGRPATFGLDPRKFQDPLRTLDGSDRASVALDRLTTLWFNTGTLCNLTCRNCYIESSPVNDRLAYLTCADVRPYLDEIARDGWPVAEIGLTGGEPFMAPDIVPILEDILARGFRALVLTNAMRPMMKLTAALLDLRDRYGDRLVLRVSLDHHTAALHEAERGPRSWEPTLAGIRWLAGHGFALHLAGRTCWGEGEAEARGGYARLIAAEGWPVDAADPAQLVLFPEMDAAADVPEITTACWGILGQDPRALMCASSRMVVRRKGAERPAVVACTLLPYDPQFELG